MGLCEGRSGLSVSSGSGDVCRGIRQIVGTVQVDILEHNGDDINLLSLSMYLFVYIYREREGVSQVPRYI